MNELKTLMRGPPARTLAVAESLTCGRVQARIGAIAGASDFFLGGITAYALEQKVKHLGVDRAHAAAVNSVSARVAEEMARGVCALFGSDLGLATTGYAEPAPAQGVAAPFAWWALHDRRTGAERHGRIERPGAARVEMQEAVAETVITALIDYLRASSGL